jgi:hypothetical protein
MDWIRKNEGRFDSLASRAWIMKQTWRNVLFLHWPIPPEYLRPLVPSALQIDIYQGQAWLGIIVFELEGIYPRGLSRLSFTPPFPEINVRTYVTYKGEPGIYFLSIDVHNWASLQIAKRWYHLPYHPSKVSLKKKGKSLHFEARRKNKPLYYIKGSYTPSDELIDIRINQLDYWLTERYRLYSSNRFSNIYTAKIDHPPWSLQKASVTLDQNTLFTPFEFNLAEDTPIAHYSDGMQTNFWNIKKLT